MHPSDRTAVILAFAGALALVPAPSAAAPTRTEQQRLVSDAAAPARSLLGSSVAISRDTTFGFALAGAPHGGTGLGAVVGFQHLPGVGFGQPLTGEATAGTTCACPLDVEHLSWADEEWGIYPRRKASGADAVLWYTPFGGGGYLLDAVADVPVEAIAIFEDTLVIGQPSYSSHSGRVLIYERGEDGYALAWTFYGSLGERLGSAVAVGPSRVFAGAPEASPNGVVRTYVRTDSGWIPWSTLVSPATSQSGAKFGAALALSLDGHLLAVGSPLVDRIIGVSGSSPVVDVGAVYLYTPDYIGWGLSRLLRPVEATAGDHFGASVAMHRDVVVAGSPREGVPLGTTGAAYVFEHVGDQWQETARLADSAPQARAFLGASVAVGDLGILVGAPRYDANGVLDQGAVLFYDVMESDRDAH